MTGKLYDLFVPVLERVQANRALLDLVNFLFGLGPTHSVRHTDGFDDRWVIDCVEIRLAPKVVKNKLD